MQQTCQMVNCYTIDGKFKNTPVLKTPTGIAIDNDSNVYVASYDYNCVIVLSSDEKNFKKVLSSKDGL